MDGLNPYDQRRIAIVGLGYRGLSILERLVLRSENSAVRFQITVFDSSCDGTGCHRTHLPNYLRLNTVSGQISLYPGKEVDATSDIVRLNGPSFSEFHAGTPDMTNDSFETRAMLGRYLSDFRDRILKRASGNCKIEFQRQIVTQIAKPERDFSVTTSQNATESFDEVILCTGHGYSPGTVVESQFPLPEKLKSISPRSRILVKGLGLQAIDTVLALTVGRGGTLSKIRNGAALQYRQNGAEPDIFMSSRSGLPFKARPNGLSVHRKHEPVIFTQQRISLLSSRGQFSLDGFLLPAMRVEMFIRWIQDMYGEAGKVEFQALKDSLRSLSNDLLNLPDWRNINALLQNHAVKLGGFDHSKLFANSLPPSVEPRQYAEWFKGELLSDVRRAEFGTSTSAEKAAAEVWRDCRAELRLAVSAETMSYKERRDFYINVVPVVNRLVTGPQLERVHELLALIDAGVVHVMHPTETEAKSKDQFFEEHVTASLENALPSISLGNLVSALGIQLNFLGKLFVTCEHQVCFEGDAVVPSLWAIGPITEGSSYYNHYVPAPGELPQSVKDADVVAKRILENALTEFNEGRNHAVE